MTLSIKRGDIRYFVLFLILCMEHQMLYLVPASWTFLGLDYQGVCALFEVLVFLESVAESGLKLKRSDYSWIFYFGLVLVVTSASAAVITYGQNLLTGLVVQRSRIGSLLFFFALLQWYKNKKITADGIWNTLIAFAVVYASICSLQYVLSNVVTFTFSTSSKKMRYGTVRYWFNGTYLVFLAGYGLDRIWSNEKHKIINVFLTLFPFVMLFVITKTRMAALALSCSFLICVIIRDCLTKKKIARIIVVVAAFCFLSSTAVGTDLMDTLLNGGAISEDTLSVRNLGRAYYVAETIKNPVRFLFGCGYASANNSTALAMTYPKVFSSIYGYSVSLYPQDNGVFGVFYYYGFLGTIWWIGIILFIVKKGWRIYKETGNTVFLGFALYETISCVTLVPSPFGRYILTPIIAILLMASEDFSLKRRT